MTFVRSYNPVWFFRDLTGNVLDDTYYAHFLTNTFPYVPQAVYRDVNGTTVWTGAVVQFDAAGALPNNLYFDNELVYRIEIRQGTTSSDPLIYEINDYVPVEENTPITPTLSGEITDNMVSNPEFVQVSFNNSTSQTANLVEISPDWDFVGTGAGTVTITRTANTANQGIVTQPAYILQIQTNGFTTAYLRQRFNNNGGLFQADSTLDRYVNASLVGKRNGVSDVPFTVTLSNSIGNSVTVINDTLTVNYQRFQSPDATSVANLLDTNSNATAYVDLNINLPATGDISLSSVQLVASTAELESVDYKQETPARQIDHTFHSFQRSAIVLPKDSLLTGWDFALNPWQLQAPSATAIANQCQYVADQTILYQQAGASNVAANRATAALGRYLQIESATANNQFAIINYMALQDIFGITGRKVSALVRARSLNQTGIRFKMRLIYRTTAAPTIGAAEPISAWTAGQNPTFSAGWTAIAPKNDPVYTLENSYDTGDGALACKAFAFDGFEIPAFDSLAGVIGVVIYTIDNMGTGSSQAIQFESASLVPNEFAVESNPRTFQQELLNCRYYYENSTPVGSYPTSASINNWVQKRQTTIVSGGSTYLEPTSFEFDYVHKIQVPTIFLNSPSTPLVPSAAPFRVNVGISVNGAFPARTGGIATTNPGWIPFDTYYALQNVGVDRAWVISKNNNLGAPALVSITGTALSDGHIFFTFVADARIGR